MNGRQSLHPHHIEVLELSGPDQCASTCSGLFPLCCCLGGGMGRSASWYTQGRVVLPLFMLVISLTCFTSTPDRWTEVSFYKHQKAVGDSVNHAAGCRAEHTDEEQDKLLSSVLGKMIHDVRELCVPWMGSK